MTLLLEKPVNMIDRAILIDDRLSDNMGKTPQGYLVAKNVPIARTGIQSYLGRELGLDKDYNKMIDVYRLPEEVFSKDTLMSLESLPITDGHPPGNFLAADNHSQFAKGHARNIRQEGDYIVADLVITDPNLISKVENKVLRQVSVGYQCYYAPHGDSFKQIQIRGNHIAIVDKGRAGPLVAIKDEKPKGTKMKTKDIQAQILKALAASDAEPEVLMQAMDMFQAEASKAEDKEPSWLAKFTSLMTASKAKDEDEEKKEDDKDDKKMEDRLTKIEDALIKLAGKKATTTDEDGDKEKLEKAMEEEKEDATDEDMDEEEKKEAKDHAPRKEAILQIAKDLKPYIAKMNANDQAAVKDTLLKAMGTKSSDSKAYGEIQKIIQKTAKRAVGDGAQDGSQRGKDIAAARNPHCGLLKAVDKA